MKQLARKAHEEFAPSDENDIYGTLIDAFLRTRQKEMAYSKDAAHRYNDEELFNFKVVIEEDFFFWTEERFKSLPDIIIGNMRDTLLKRNEPIQRKPRLLISTALAQFILNVQTESFTEHGSRVEE